MFAAVCPVTASFAPVAFSRPPDSARIAATRSSVWVLLGPLFGITVSNAVSPFWLTRAGVTAATSGSFWMSAAAWPSAAWRLVLAPTSTTTSSGPLDPSPKLRLAMSYAFFCVDSGAAVLSLGRPSCMPSAGSATTAIPASATSSTGIRWRATNRAQRSPCVVSTGLRRSRIRPPATRCPAKPRTAGSSVSAMSTATATVTAAATPIWPRNGMPTTVSPASAMMTVSPANTTAEPAVPTARPAASSGSRPRLSSCR